MFQEFLSKDGMTVFLVDMDTMMVVSSEPVEIKEDDCACGNQEPSIDGFCSQCSKQTNRLSA